MVEENVLQTHAKNTIPAFARGGLAGIAGAIAMSASTNAEMRLRGRPPSYAPAEALGRVLGVKIRGRRRKLLLGSLGHLGTSVSLGVARGLLDRAGVDRRPAGAALYALTLAPEMVAVPALGVTDPPWKWSAVDMGVSILHHGVFAAATNAAYERLSQRPLTR